MTRQCPPRTGQEPDERVRSPSRLATNSRTSRAACSLTASRIERFEAPQPGDLTGVNRTDAVIVFICSVVPLSEAVFGAVTNRQSWAMTTLMAATGAETFALALLLLWRPPTPGRWVNPVHESSRVQVVLLVMLAALVISTVAGVSLVGDL